VISEPEAIATLIRSKAPHAKRIGLETDPTTTCCGTSSGRWACR
jgi:hypothetical protein